MNVKTVFSMLVLLLTAHASGGLNAQQSYIAPLVNESLLLDLAKANSYIVVGERGHVLVSQQTDMSVTIESFKQVAVPTKVTLTAVYSMGDNAWSVGHDATILKSIDAGKTWRLLQTAPELDRPLLDVLFFDELEGIAVGAYGLFYRTSDGGDTWLQEQHPSVLSDDDNEYLDSIKDDNTFYLEELSFISPHFNQLGFANGVLYLAGEAGLIAKSLDKGRSWERIDLSYLGSFFDIAILPNNLVLAVGLRGNMFVLNDEQWSSIPTCITTSLNTIIVDESSIWVTGNNGVLLSVDINALDTNELKPADKEGCQIHSALRLIPSDFSDAILDGVKLEQFLAITSGGLKTVVIE